MDNKSSSSSTNMMDNLTGPRRGYQIRRDEQKMRKAHGGSMPVVHAPSEHNRNLKHSTRASEHIPQSHGNNIINNGIYIDANKVRDRVED